MSTVEDVFESWEEMEESGALDKKLKALEVNSVDGHEDKTRNKDCDADTRIIILGDGTMSQYTPKPTVKILKRPDRNSQSNGQLLNGDKPKQPIKTLKQREQEYAEARKRILGEEKSPEENVVPEVNRIQGKSIIAGGSSLPLNITRLPMGPDGTRGFNVRRGRRGYEAKSNVPPNSALGNPENIFSLHHREIFELLPFVGRYFRDSTRTMMPLYNQSQSNHDFATTHIVSE